MPLDCYALTLISGDVQLSVVSSSVAHMNASFVPATRDVNLQVKVCFILLWERVSTKSKLPATPSLHI
jgi:hypothetical protein